MPNSRRKKRPWDDDPPIFYIGGQGYVGIDPRRHPPFPEWCEADWIAQRDELITEKEYLARFRLRRRLGLKGSDPLPSAEIISFPVRGSGK